MKSNILVQIDVNTLACLLAYPYTIYKLTHDIDNSHHITPEYLHTMIDMVIEGREVMPDLYSSIPEQYLKDLEITTKDVIWARDYLALYLKNKLNDGQQNIFNNSSAVND